MNTAEVAIEHVIAGILAAVVIVLPFVEPKQFELLKETPAAIAFLGGAYLLGVVTDKVFDTILGGVENLIRRKECKKRRDRITSPPAAAAEWFAQDMVEAAARRGADGGVQWMNHLRTRIRLTRTLAVLAPLIGIALARWLAPRWAHGDWVTPEEAPAWYVLLLPTAILVVGLVVAVRLPEWRYDAPEELPWRIAARPLLVIAVFALLLTFVTVGLLPQREVVAAVSAGWTVAALAFWAWRRLMRTYLKFLGALDRLPVKE